MDVGHAEAAVNVQTTVIFLTASCPNIIELILEYCFHSNCSEEENVDLPCGK